MASLNEYFHTEARDFLTALERSLERSPAPDAAELHRSVRGLRGTAQMAREQRVFDVVSAFESVTRSLAGGALVWSDHVADRARDTIADLRVLLDRTEEDEQLDARVSEAAARWTDTGSAPVTGAAPPLTDNDTRELREFAAREAAGIADALDNGIQALQSDPMDRESLRTILRRQRALLGSARLEEIPVVAEILRAVEDLTRVITKLDVGVKQEWLDIYRVARDALQSTIAPLLRDEIPQPSKAVSRLRHMREELLERYGTDEDEAAPQADTFAEPVLSRPAPAVSDAPAAAAGPYIARPRQDVAAPHETVAQEPAAGDMLELSEDSVVDASADDVRESGEPIVTDEPTARGFETADASIEPAESAVFELVEEIVAAAAPDDVPDPRHETEIDASYDDVPEPGGDTAVEASYDDVLELSEDTAVEASYDDVLELSEDTAVEASYDEAPEPGEAAVHEAAAGDALDIGAFSYSREDALQRALELRDVITRAVAHDPQARDAVDELFDLIGIVLG